LCDDREAGKSEPYLSSGSDILVSSYNSIFTKKPQLQLDSLVPINGEIKLNGDLEPENPV
jgi:hypothetical protein